MATSNKEKTYWPHMIVGFIFMAIVLGYWTIKSASSMPVQEVNMYMQKYQLVDININEIMVKKEAFDKNFAIELLDKKTIINEDNRFSNRKAFEYIELKQGKNNFVFNIKTLGSTTLQEPKVSFLLTRPHTRVDDQYIQDIKLDNGYYTINDIEISKKGRYVIQFRVDTVDGSIGYFEKDAYLN
ncbi:MAG: hypothetical protein JXQ76_13430 [Campylobacterales bacterium]|nr:hypothetical protein [Campylobacterales bacterium]